MGNRLGSAFPPEGFEWWCKFMGRTAVSTQLGFGRDDRLRRYPRRSAEDRLPDAGHHHRGKRARHGRATRAWQQQIPNSELLVLPGNSYHVAATHADRCAEETLQFILKHRK